MISWVTDPSRYHLGRDNDFDVVLIDTAGRMQDNEVCRRFDRQSLVEHLLNTSKCFSNFSFAPLRLTTITTHKQTLIT
jgi:hypothetical protein